MDVDHLFRRYQEFQAYVGWSDDDAPQGQAVASLLDPSLPGLIEDFYAEIERHPAARRVITGGQPQNRPAQGNPHSLAPRAAGGTI